MLVKGSIKVPEPTLASKMISGDYHAIVSQTITMICLIHIIVDLFAEVLTGIGDEKVQ